MWCLHVEGEAVLFLLRLCGFCMDDDRTQLRVSLAQCPLNLFRQEVNLTQWGLCLKKHMEYQA